MVEQENTQRAKEFLAASLRGDVPSILESLADDIEWVVPGPSDLPWTGTFTGKQAVVSWLGGLHDIAAFQVFEPREFIAQGDKVVALVYAEYTTQRHGRKLVS